MKPVSNLKENTIITYHKYTKNLLVPFWQLPMFSKLGYQMKQMGCLTKFVQKQINYFQCALKIDLLNSNLPST